MKTKDLIIIASFIVVSSMVSSGLTYLFFRFGGDEKKLSTEHAPEMTENAFDKIADVQINNEQIIPEECRKAAASLCPNIDVDNGLGSCVLDNEEKLGAQCKEFLSKVTDELKICRSDIKKHCSSVRAGKGRIVGCLLPHRLELNLKCREWVEAKSEKIS